ncbi:MAG TPA: caspase family protein [Tepidisphaeraceae bacterium]|jgi:hypothetical protein
MSRLHVFIVGVSDYSNLPGETDPMTPNALGLRKLTSPALSALRVYDWIIDHKNDLPLSLGHTSLLLSPSPQEQAIEPSFAARANDYQPCDLANFLRAADAWRAAALSDPKDMTLFYFAGHGLRWSTNDAILMLRDVGQGAGGVLLNAIDLNNLYAGMAPSESQPDVARTQVYFVDACRVEPAEITRIQRPTPSEVFRVDLRGRVDDRQTPIFFATVGGATAIGRKAKSSIFSELLLDCLNGDAGQRSVAPDGTVSWTVTTQSLARALNELFADLATAGVDQACTVEGAASQDIPLCRLNGPPKVPVLIAVDPVAAAPDISFRVMNSDTLAVVFGPQVLNPHPHFDHWPAGMYHVLVEAPPGHALYKSPAAWSYMVVPPRWTLTPKVLK